MRKKGRIEMAGRSMTMDERIVQAQEQVIKTKARYDEAVAALEQLLAKKKAMLLFLRKA